MNTFNDAYVQKLWKQIMMMIMFVKHKIIVDDYKNKFYFVDYKMHREDGPAIEHSNGHKEWFLYGKRHRLDKDFWLFGHRVQ